MTNRLYTITHKQSGQIIAMILADADLIRKKSSGQVATAILAIPAIPVEQSKESAWGTVATIATIAVANPREAKTKHLEEAASPHQAYSRLCREDYEISVTRAIDVTEHIRNRGRVITTAMTDMIPTTPSLE